MPQILTVCLTPEQEEQLQRIRDTDQRPYMRERAAALLKVSSGISGHQVALNGLLKERDPDTVYSWIHRYQVDGLDGLSIKPGRGRKPAYAPRYQDQEEAKTAILHIVRREPSTFGLSSSRWSLGLIARVCDWLRVTNPSSLSQLLKRLGISYQRGRSYVLLLLQKLSYCWFYKDFRIGCKTNKTFRMVAKATKLCSQSRSQLSAEDGLDCPMPA